jgi:hypothetical protein
MLSMQVFKVSTVVDPLMYHRGVPASSWTTAVINSEYRISSPILMLVDHRGGMGVDLLAEQLVGVEVIIQGGTAVTSDNKRRNDRERRGIYGFRIALLISWL